MQGSEMTGIRNALAGQHHKQNLFATATIVSTTEPQQTGTPRQCIFLGKYQAGIVCSDGGAALFGLTSAYHDPVSVHSLSSLDKEKKSVESALREADAHVPLESVNIRATEDWCLRKHWVSVDIRKHM